MLSDLCPHTSGNPSQDALLSIELAEKALNFACFDSIAPINPNKGGVLKPGGNIVIKLLEGSGTEGTAF